MLTDGNTRPRVSIAERLVPALALGVTAIAGAVGAWRMIGFFQALRSTETAGFAAFYGGLAEIEGQPLEGQAGGAVFRMLTEKLGQKIRLRIRRGAEERELEIAVGGVELVNYRIVDSKSPTPEQLKVRESWLKR